MSANAARAVLAGCLLALLCSSHAGAQDTAKRPARILVGAVPGSTADTQMRMLLPLMSEALGQGLIIDNRAGANGVLAAETAARAAPGGHTLVLGNQFTHAIHASLYSRPGYDPLRAFTPVSQLSLTGFVVTAHPRLAGDSILEFAAQAKRTPHRLSVSVSGLSEEIASGALWARLGMRVASVRPKDVRMPTQALTTGEVELALLAPPSARAHVHAGRLKALGITSQDRSSILPEVPTLLEQGLSDFVFPLWDGLFAPAGTPAEMVDAIARAVALAMQAPAVRIRYDELGLTIVGSSPEQFAGVVKHDVERFRKLVAESGVARH